MVYRWSQSPTSSQTPVLAPDHEEVAEAPLESGEQEDVSAYCRIDVVKTMSCSVIPRSVQRSVQRSVEKRIGRRFTERIVSGLRMANTKKLLRGGAWVPEMEIKTTTGTGIGSVL